MKASLLLAVSIGALVAMNSQAAPAADQSPPSNISAKAVKLPYGVEDVLKLSKAQISQDVIVKFIENSGTIYNLSPEVLVYLRNEGVSDRVLNTMLDQPKKVAATTSYWSSQAQAGNTAPAQAQPQPQVAPIYNQPPQPEPQPAPQPPVSTVHVIPYYQAEYATPFWPSYSGYYYPGYYGSYLGWRGPGISLGFGFGFGGHHHFRAHCR